MAAQDGGEAEDGDGGHGGGGETEPAKPEEELLTELAEAITFVRSFLTERDPSLAYIIAKSGFERNAAIVAAKEAANENDETRKRFDAGLTAREAALDIKLGDYSAWLDSERIAVNVHTLYREFGDPSTPPGPIQMFELMAELAP